MAAASPDTAEQPLHGATQALAQLSDQPLSSSVVCVQPELDLTNEANVVLEEAAAHSTWRKWARRLSKALVVLGLLLLVAAVLFYPHKSQKLTELLLWVQQRPVTGFLIFLLLYIVCTVAFVPVTLLSVAAGAVFGIWVGMALVWLGAICGETIAFLIGRFLLRGWVKKAARQHQTWRALEAALREEGWKVVLLLRMAPILPFALLNYAMGSSAVQFTSFFAASSLGVVPGIMMHVYLGTLVKDISTIHSASSAPERARIVVLVVSLVSCVVALVASTLVARHALLKRLRAIEESDLNHGLLNDDQAAGWHCRAPEGAAPTPLAVVSHLHTKPGTTRQWALPLRRTKSLGGEAASGGCLSELGSTCAVFVAVEDACGSGGPALGVGGRGNDRGEGSSGAKGCHSSTSSSGGHGSGGGTAHDGTWAASGGRPVGTEQGSACHSAAGSSGTTGRSGWPAASQQQFLKGQWPDLPSAASDPDAEELTPLCSGQPGAWSDLQAEVDHQQAAAGAGHQQASAGAGHQHRQELVAGSEAGARKPRAAGLWPAGVAAGSSGSSGSATSLLVGSSSWPPARESLLGHETPPGLPP